MDSFIEALILVAIVLVIVAVGVTGYNDIQRPILELKKDEWVCVKEEKRTQLQPLLVGKTTILQPILNTYCTEYKRW
jgi:hypothetical protein